MLFQESENTRAQQVKEYISVNVSTGFQLIKPYIAIAEQDYIKPLLGDDLYDELDDYANDSGSGSGSDSGSGSGAGAELMDKLLDRTRRALINLAFYRGYSMISIKISDKGVHRMESENELTLYKYQEQALINTFKNDGFNGLDAVLEFLEDNIEEFPDFAASDSYTVFKARFIRTASDFSSIFNINKSRLVFLRLQPYVQQVEDFEILPTIGSDLFDKLKEEIIKKADEQDETLMKVVSYIQKAIAYLAVSKAISELPVNITEKSVYFETSRAASGDSVEQTTLSDVQVERIANNNKMTGLNYMQYLTDFLHNNIDDYPEYAEFYGYNDGEPIKRDNTDKKTFLT